MQRLVLAPLLLLTACQGGAGPAPSASSSSSLPDWRTTGPFAVKRAALKTAVETFPADTSALARCAADRRGMLMVSYNLARTLYAPGAPAAPDIDSGAGIDVAARRTYLESIERAAWQSAAPEERARWEKPPFEGVTAVVLYKPAKVTAPEKAECRKEEGGDSCRLVPGVVEGDAVVFDDSGKPVCANKVRIEGPVYALIASTGKLSDHQRTGVEQILDGLYYYGSETPPKDAPWRFLSLHQAGISPPERYTVTIDGAVVQTGKGK